MSLKRWLFWSFDRGSFQYDVLCALILILMFAIPPSVFNDRPGWMRIPESGIRRTVDDDGIVVYTVKVGETSDQAASDWAIGALASYLGGETPDVFRAEEIHDTRGRIVAHAFWMR